jgi:DNA-binding winged helix-turn-helix (wHTH) protein
MTSATAHLLRFEGHTLDPARRFLSRDGELLTLRPQAMEVLCHLARQAGSQASVESRAVQGNLARHLGD